MSYTRTPTEHSQTTSFQSSVMRAPSPAFCPPVPSGMLEPGANYITIITAEGPFTTSAPTGRGRGIDVSADNFPPAPVARLTRKGG